jgi:lysophospholipase L1-like esterase
VVKVAEEIKKTILFLGDSLISYTTERKRKIDDNGIKTYEISEDKKDKRNAPEIVKDRSSAIVINGGMPGGRYKTREEADKNYISDAEYVLGELLPVFTDLKKETREYKANNNPINDLWNEVEKIDSDTGEDKYISGIQRGYYELKEWINGLYEKTATENKKIVDVVILAYGTNDWSHSVHFEDINKFSATGKKYLDKGSGSILKELITKIQTTLPEASILVLSPLWGQNKNGNTFDNIKINNRNLEYWVNEIEKICKNYRVAFLNSYSDLQFSKENRVYYSYVTNEGEVDRIHLNFNGSERYAEVIIGKLISILGDNF